MAIALDEQLLETWRIHARIVLYTLEAADPDGLTWNGIKGRTAAEQLAHIHNVRLMWLESAAPDLLAGLAKVARPASSKDVLASSLEASGRAIESLLARGLEAGRIRASKPHPPAFLAYLVAHEFFHAGDAGVRLTASGHPLDQKVAYGMWEWGSR